MKVQTFKDLHTRDGRNGAAPVGAVPIAITPHATRRDNAAGAQTDLTDMNMSVALKAAWGAAKLALHVAAH